MIDHLHADEQRDQDAEKKVQLESVWNVRKQSGYETYKDLSVRLTRLI